MPKYLAMIPDDTPAWRMDQMECALRHVCGTWGIEYHYIGGDGDRLDPVERELMDDLMARSGEEWHA